MAANTNPTCKSTSALVKPAEETVKNYLMKGKAPLVVEDDYSVSAVDLGPGSFIQLYLNKSTITPLAQHKYESRGSNTDLAVVSKTAPIDSRSKMVVLPADSSKIGSPGEKSESEGYQKIDQDHLPSKRGLDDGKDSLHDATQNGVLDSYRNKDETKKLSETIHKPSRVSSSIGSPSHLARLRTTSIRRGITMTHSQQGWKVRYLIKCVS